MANDIPVRHFYNENLDHCTVAITLDFIFTTKI